MKLLHTADWHIGSNWKGVDRAEDLLQRAVPDLVGIALDEQVDLVLIAGDVFEKQTTESLQQAAETLSKPFRALLDARIDIALLVGNHDSPPLFRVLRSAIELVDGESKVRGHIHILNSPWYLPNVRGIQILSLPYMRAEQILLWLQEELSDDANKSELVNWELGRKLDRAAGQLRERLDHSRPALLTYHGVVQGATIGIGVEEFEMTYNQGFMLTPTSLLANDQVPQYNALGHVHKAQKISSAVPTHYAGSIDRLNQGEREYTPSVILVEFPEKGRRVEIQERLLPRPTPFLGETIRSEGDIRALAAQLRTEQCERALGRILLNCDAMESYALDQLARDTFPRLKHVKEAVLRPRQELNVTLAAPDAPFLQELSNPRKAIRSFIQHNVTKDKRPALLRALELVESEL